MHTLRPYVLAAWCLSASIASAKPEQARVSDALVTVRTAPHPTAKTRGTIAPGSPFWVVRGDAGSDRCAAGWVEVEAGGFVCLDGTRVTRDDPQPQPVLMAFDPPEPEEYDAYVRTGEYDHDDKVAIVPEIYGRRWKRFQGQLWASVDAYVRGDEPTGKLTGKTGERLGFTGVVDTRRGTLLVRDDGQVAPLDDVYVYPVSRLEGRDLERDPLPEGTLPAITIAYAGAKVHEEWRKDSPVVGARLPYHTWITVDSTPDPSGHWWGLRDGKRVVGWLEDDGSIRRPVPSPGRPEGVGASELWVDVALEQQVLSVWRGDTMVYFTVVSSGVDERETPGGTFRVQSKQALSDMSSRPDAAPEDWYRVEDVPWTIAFRSRYALHGAYWHWGFGRPASHGCINLAPRDAAHLFATLSPPLPDGWRSISALDDEGTMIRIRPKPEPEPERDDAGDAGGDAATPSTAER